MSKTDLDQMILRGQEKMIFESHIKNGQQEESKTEGQEIFTIENYDQYVQKLAEMSYLEIRLVDRKLVGDEVYEELQLESLYARELGTKQMMKERDFDIILNVCKQRVEFQKCLVELERQEKNQIAEEALSFEQSIEENLSDDEDPGLMESALSGLSDFKLNTDDSSRSTFNAATPKLLADKLKPNHDSREMRQQTSANQR